MAGGGAVGDFDRAARERQPELTAQGDVETGQVERRPGEDRARYGGAITVRAEMEVERVAHLSGDTANAIGERKTSKLGMLQGSRPARAIYFTSRAITTKSRLPVQMEIRN